MAVYMKMFHKCQVCNLNIYHEDAIYYLLGEEVCYDCNEKYEEARAMMMREFNERYIDDARRRIDLDRDTKMIENMLADEYPAGYNEYGFKIGEF